MADIITCRGVSREWKLMQKAERYTEEELTDLQNERLQALVRHCYDHVSYYRNLFDQLLLKPEDIKTRDDLQKLPVLTKQMVRDHYDELIADNAAVLKSMDGSTGGSTGTPLKFKKDVQTWNMAWASSFRAWEWYGYHLGEKLITLGGNSLVKKKKGTSAKDIFDKVIMRNMKRSSGDVTDEAMQKHYEAYIQYKPKAMRGYASSMVIFARYIEKNHLPVAPLKVILTTGEILMPEYRRTLERVFQCKVYDEYGAGDGGVDAHECLLQHGLHLSEERCVVEITDKEGNVLPDGQTGYVCATDLGNYAFPFLRYHVGDMAYIQHEKCPCGRVSRVLGQVMGRAGKLLYNKQGVPISPTMLPIMLYRDNDYHNADNVLIYNKIDRFQIRQDKEGDIRVLLKLKDPNENRNQFDYIISNYSNHFIGSKVTLEFVDKIPTLPSGKEDYCVSEYK
jgi:phenylacetate-CoA ligase